jgi:cation:H+ antiporter
MDFLTLLQLAAGLMLLTLGGEALVRGASRLAAAAGIPHVIIGLTVVAFGTSAPEAAVGVGSALTGRPDIVLGNVVGSNIFNVLFILGLSALISPLVVQNQLVRLDVPVLVGVSVLVLVMALDGDIDRFDGLLLFGGALAYTALLVRLSRRGAPAAAPPAAPVRASITRREVFVDLGLVAASLGLLPLGARLLVEGAVVVARDLGLSELVIGLTVIAAGTSLPEVATSLTAALRGERDIAVGNIVGSNLFNLLFVLGLCGLVSPDAIAVASPLLRFDLPVMLAVAAACLPVFFTGHRVDSWEGGVFLLYYFFYAAYVVLAATGNAALPAFTGLLLEFLLPLTVLTLIVLFAHAVQQRRG